MAFDRYRHQDASRPNYRFFPNRTRAQTRAISWAALGIGCFLTVFFLKAFEQNDERLTKYYNQLAAKNPQSAAQAQVDAQNNRLTEIFYRARRAYLSLPQRPRVPLQIEEEDNS